MNRNHASTEPEVAEMLEETMLEKKVWAVVGANRNPEKYGNMIYKKLKRKGYEVYAVNPGYETVEEDPCYPTLPALPVVPDVVNFVIPPARGMSVVEEAAKLGIKYLWLQPGTHNEELMARIEELGLEAVQACVLVATR
jgi:predicted CoA-binding protein